jgi:hypothetical protein
VSFKLIVIISFIQIKELLTAAIGFRQNSFIWLSILDPVDNTGINLATPLSLWRNLHLCRYAPKWSTQPHHLWVYSFMTF